MTEPSLETLIRWGGLTHLAIAAASLAVPGQLDWKHRLAVLDPFHRRLFWVYAAFILYVNVGLGILSLHAASTLASGVGLGRLVSGFIALYWILRLGVQLAVFDHRAVVRGRLAGLCYHGLTAGFIFLIAVYSLAASGLWS